MVFTKSPYFIPIYHRGYKINNTIKEFANNFGSNIEKKHVIRLSYDILPFPGQRGVKLSAVPGQHCDTTILIYFCTCDISTYNNFLHE